jgi:hypothetical protein
MVGIKHNNTFVPVNRRCNQTLFADIIGRGRINLPPHGKQQQSCTQGGLIYESNTGTKLHSSIYASYETVLAFRRHKNNQ